MELLAGCMSQAPLTLAGAQEGSATTEDPVELQDEFDLSDILAESVDAAARSKADLLADIDTALQVEHAGLLVSQMLCL